MSLCINRDDAEEGTKVKGEALTAQVKTMRRILWKGI